MHSRLCPVSSVQEFYSEGAGRVVRTVGMLRGYAVEAVEVRTVGMTL